MIARPIETERLVLHPLKVGDADEMLAVLADGSLYEFDGGEPPTLDSLRTRYRHQVSGSGTPDEIWLNWIIRTAENDRAVGFVQADLVGDTAELGWLVGVADQGTGVATESASAVTDWLVGHGVRRIEAHIQCDHLASLAVAERLGLSDTGAVDADGEMVWASDPPTSEVDDQVATGIVEQT